MSDEKIIKSEAQFKNLMEERRGKAALRQVNEEAMHHADHAAVASQSIKVVNSIKMDPFIKKVMTLRIIGPLVTGHERSHLSIALELGTTEDDVKQAEDAGIQIVSALLQKCSTPEFVEKFNRENTAEKLIRAEINKQGKSQ